jgi:hypothetical protein
MTSLIDWQLAFAGGCARFIFLLVATQPLRPLPSLWRPILLILSWLGAAAVLRFTVWQWASELMHRRWPVDNLPYPGIQVVTCVGVAILEVGLGTWEIRRIVQECQTNRSSERGSL